MSRGGRGGFRGGRGGGGGAGFGKGRMGGVELPWDYDPDLKIENEPSKLFPPIPVPVPDPPRREERMQVARYRGLRDRTHEGPLYTVRGDNVRIGKFAPSRTATFDPFDSMPAFTDKYRKKRRSAPRLDTRPYVMYFFPSELHSTIDPTPAANGTTKRKAKKLQIDKSNRLSRLDELEEEGEGPNAENADDVDKDPEDDEENAEEEQDEDFEEDEEENDDYNAQNYYEDADDEYDDVGADGGGGGHDDEH